MYKSILQSVLITSCINRILSRQPNVPLHHNAAASWQQNLIKNHTRPDANVKGLDKNPVWFLHHRFQYPSFCHSVQDYDPQWNSSQRLKV